MFSRVLLRSLSPAAQRKDLARRHEARRVPTENNHIKRKLTREAKGTAKKLFATSNTPSSIHLDANPADERSFIRCQIQRHIGHIQRGRKPSQRNRRQE